MTAFLFIPSATGCGPSRRVNFADIANLFVETELPRSRRDRTPVMRIALAIMIALGAVGDTMLVSRSDTLASCLATGHVDRPVSAAARS